MEALHDSGRPVAASPRMSRQARLLAATLCAHSAVSDPASSGEHHSVSLAEDLQRRFGYRAALRRGRHHEKRGKTRTELPWPRATSKCTAAGRGQNTVIFLVCSRGLTALPAA